MIIAIIVADEFELKMWPLGGKAVAGTPFGVKRLVLGAHTLFILHSGIGLVNAAAATSYAITALKVERIVNYGVVGATKQHSLGSIVLPSEIFNIDVQTPWYPDGVTPREKPFFVTTEQSSSVKLGSSSRFISSKAMVKPWIKKGVSIFDMEGVAIAQVAAHFKIPVTLIKAVSDHLDATPASLDTLNAQIEKSALNAAKAAVELVQSLH